MLRYFQNGGVGIGQVENTEAVVWVGWLKPVLSIKMTAVRISTLLSEG